MLSKNPIGIFDSGVGGLSIALRIREILSNENLLYVADSSFAPYGEKTEDFVIQRSLSISEFLLKKNVKAVVVACNTATVSAIQVLRSKYSIPIIGVEPGVKPAALSSKSGVVGALVTTKTFSSNSFNALASRFSTNVKIAVQPCPGLVEQVEALELSNEKTDALIRKYVKPLLDKGADNIVLGCTHYAFLAPAIKEVAGPNVEIINTDIAVARQVARRLAEEELLTANVTIGYDEFWSNGHNETVVKQFSSLWGREVNVFQM